MATWRICTATLAMFFLASMSATSVSYGEPDERSKTLANVQINAEPKLVINEDFADPGVIKTEDGYVAFSTSSTKGKIPVARAAKPDGSWSIQGDALKTFPAWVKSDSGFWAPDATQSPDGTYVLYFSATSAETNQMCIGAATGSKPHGPYEPTTKPLVCVPEDQGDIDPDVFIDADGKRYLLYKSNGSQVGAPATIWLHTLASNGLSLEGGRREILRADLHREKTVVEAPVVVKQATQYLLFYSADTFQSSGYHTSYATAQNLIGPYIKANNQFMSTNLLQGKVDGPGGADVVDGHIFFHGWLQPEHKTRGLFTLPIHFNNDLPHLPN